MRIEFTDRCVARGIDKATATEVYDMIEKFASYGFNKSHSAAYARVSYETAYLKAHYPECFMAANLTINANNKEKLLTSLVETRNMGIPILPPDIRNSYAIFSVESLSTPLKSPQHQYGIRFGLGGVESIGEDVAEEIEHQNVSTLFDFVSAHPNLRKNQLEKLIDAGAFDMFGSRKDMIEILPDMREFIKQKTLLQDIYGHTLLNLVEGEDYYDGFEYSLSERMLKEKNAINISLSGHVLDYIRPIHESYENLDRLPHLLSKDDGDEVNVLVILREMKVITTKKTNKPMAFVTLEDEYIDLEGVIFPRIYEDVSHLLNESTPYLIHGHMQVENAGGEDEKRTIVVEGIERVLEKDLRIFIPKKILKQTEIIEELKGCNGICQVLTIDEDMIIQQSGMYVDVARASEVFDKHHIHYFTNAKTCNA